MESAIQSEAEKPALPYMIHRPVFRMFALFLSCSALLAQTPAQQAPRANAAVPIMPLSQVRAGMTGEAYTVFAGVTPEAMQVEVLGVIKNANGPRQDIILVRLRGEKPEYTGVVAGMSGSPVYVDHKLIGALAFRIGEFSKEPIAGVTPIEEMLEINEFDRSQPEPQATDAASGKSPDVNARSTRTSAPGAENLNASDFIQLMRPIETPLVFSGFTEEAVRQFAPQFARAGLVPVMGAGSVSDEKQPEPLQPGSSVSMLLVRGDLDIAATCTVTYVDATHLLACGHPVLQFGAVNVPMNKARVVATLPSPANSFKIINTTETVGSFVQDRHAGILGIFGKTAAMIPVSLQIKDGVESRQYHFEVINNPELAPLAVAAGTFSTLHALNDADEDTSYRLSGDIRINGYPQVSLHNIFPPGTAITPPMSAALLLHDRFARLFDNPSARPQIEGVQLSVELVNNRREAQLESAHIAVTEARPGDSITVEAVLHPYRGERLLEQIPVKIPVSAPRGTLQILVSDGNTLDRIRGVAEGRNSSRLNLASTIALLNQEHANNRLYVTLMEADPQAVMNGTVMPELPPSILNVISGAHPAQDLALMSESTVGEASLPLDYAVEGSQLLTLTIK
jgi:hypothetical protein